MDIQKLFSDALAHEASDLHLTTGYVPGMRVDGDIVPVPDADIITETDSNQLLEEFLEYINTVNRFVDSEALFFKNCHLDGSYLFENIYTKQRHNCRVNAFLDLNGKSFAIRFIPNKIPTMESLRLPYVFKSLIQKKEHGLILVTGPTGSGKTTTLTAMLNAINETRSAHILTLEDPIEYVHYPKKCIISQREILRTVPSFSSGLKAALREDPDVIFIGEMRDQETVEIALNAAETGHLVLSTLHTASVIEAIDRIMQYFPEHRHTQVQTQLANCFEGIIAQKLFPRKQQPGRIAAFEILTRTNATVNLIRRGEAFRLRDYMGRCDGMQTMEDSISDLEQRKLI